MEYRKLGLTDLEVSRLGFGCWGIGGHGYGHTDDEVSIRAIRGALDSGINLFDTADVYGFGHSEEILRKALGGRRKDVVIATKFGLAWDKRGKAYRDCSPRRIAEAVEGSLRRLELECIPLYQMHWYDGITPFEEVLEALEKLKKTGKIKHVGCSNIPLDLIIKTKNSSCRIESFQTLYNIMERTSELSIHYCANMLNMGVLAYGVIARGLFSGKYDSRSVFGDLDTRSRDSNFQGEKLESNLGLVRVLKDIGGRHGKTPSQVAIAWVLNNPDVTSALVGIKYLEQVMENIEAVSWVLNQEESCLISNVAGTLSEGGAGRG